MSENLLFDDSFQRLFGHGVGIDAAATPFFEAFYRNFLRDEPIRHAFSNTDMARQVTMLRKSFFHLAAFYASNEPSAELERIARIHCELGIENAHFDLWLDALVKTVKEFDPRCDSTTELAWRLAMTPGLTYLRMFHYFQQPQADNP